MSDMIVMGVVVAFREQQHTRYSYNNMQLCKTREVNIFVVVVVVVSFAQMMMMMHERIQRNNLCTATLSVSRYALLAPRVTMTS